MHICHSDLVMWRWIYANEISIFSMGNSYVCVECVGLFLHDVLGEIRTLRISTRALYDEICLQEFVCRNAHASVILLYVDCFGYIQPRLVGFFFICKVVQRKISLKILWNTSPPPALMMSPVSFLFCFGRWKLISRV
jgi:hypothetical protein